MKCDVGYSDSDWDGSPQQKSISGSALFHEECLVAWKSRKRQLAALLTMESEMNASVEAYKEQKAVHKLFEESRIVEESLNFFYGNQAVVQIAHDTGYNGRAKHIGLRLLAIQDIIARLKIDLRFCHQRETVQTSSAKLYRQRCTNRPHLVYFSRHFSEREICECKMLHCTVYTVVRLFKIEKTKFQALYIV